MFPLPGGPVRIAGPGNCRTPVVACVSGGSHIRGTPVRCPASALVPVGVGLSGVSPPSCCGRFDLGPLDSGLRGLRGQVKEALPAVQVQGLNPPSEIGRVPWPRLHLGPGSPVGWLVPFVPWPRAALVVGRLWVNWRHSRVTSVVGHGGSTGDIARRLGCDRLVPFVRCRASPWPWGVRCHSPCRLPPVTIPSGGRCRACRVSIGVNVLAPTGLGCPPTVGQGWWVFGLRFSAVRPNFTPEGGVMRQLTRSMLFRER